MEIEVREKKIIVYCIILPIEMGIRKNDVQRQQDHHQFIKKKEEFMKDIKELKENLIKVTGE